VRARNSPLKNEWEEDRGRKLNFSSHFSIIFLIRGFAELYIASVKVNEIKGKSCRSI
jgi:hypothetical protein